MGGANHRSVSRCVRAEPDAMGMVGWTGERRISGGINYMVATPDPLIPSQHSHTHPPRLPPAYTLTNLKPNLSARVDQLVPL
jgi:hypothetical protein